MFTSCLILRNVGEYQLDRHVSMISLRNRQVDICSGNPTVDMSNSVSRLGFNTTGIMLNGKHKYVGEDRSISF
jgi:hypothetical protein